MSGIITPISATELGAISSFVVVYNTTIAVTVRLGRIRANNKTYILAVDTPHTMTSLAAGFDLHYIYIDDSADTAPIPTFIDSIIEPTFNAALNGFYNGDDLCIGVISSLSTGATIAYFEVVVINNNHIRNFLGAIADGQIGNSMLPNGTYQVPNINESSVLVPVNAEEIYLMVQGQDIAGFTTAAAASKEWAIVNTDPIDAPLLDFGAEVTTGYGWIPLGITRDIRMAGDAGDDAGLSVFNAGYGYRR